MSNTNTIKMPQPAIESLGPTVDPMIQSTAVGESVQSFNLSFWDLFMGADWVVQLVMVLLVAASIWCWTIIFAKFTKLKQLNSQAQKFEETFWSGTSLDHLYDSLSKRTPNPMTELFSVGMAEWRRRSSRGGAMTNRLTVQERIQRIMNVHIARETEAVEKYMIFLASVGSTAPFVGLFGTVWGIMDSFQGIAASQSTNLAVVAPGIAEALFATAVGLIAAIPAVLAYNKLSTEINRYVMRLELFADEFLTVVSRQIEEAA